MKRKYKEKEKNIYESIDLLSKEMAKIYIKNNKPKLISEIETDIEKKSKHNNNSINCSNNNSSDIYSNNNISLVLSQKDNSNNSINSDNSKDSKKSKNSENSKFIKYDSKNEDNNRSNKYEKTFSIVNKNKSNIKNFKKKNKSMKNVSPYKKKKQNENIFRLTDKKRKKVSFADNDTNIYRNSNYFKSNSELNSNTIKFNDNDNDKDKELETLSPIHKKGEKNEIIYENFKDNDILSKTMMNYNDNFNDIKCTLDEIRKRQSVKTVKTINNKKKKSIIKKRTLKGENNLIQSSYLDKINDILKKENNFPDEAPKKKRTKELTNKRSSSKKQKTKKNKNNKTEIFDIDCDEIDKYMRMLDESSNDEVVIINPKQAKSEDKLVHNEDFASAFNNTGSNRQSDNIKLDSSNNLIVENNNNLFVEYKKIRKNGSYRQFFEKQLRRQKLIEIKINKIKKDLELKENKKNNNSAPKINKMSLKILKNKGNYIPLTKRAKEIQNLKNAKILYNQKLKDKNYKYNNQSDNVKKTQKEIDDFFYVQMKWKAEIEKKNDDLKKKLNLEKNNSEIVHEFKIDPKSELIILKKRKKQSSSMSDITGSCSNIMINYSINRLYNDYKNRQKRLNKLEKELTPSFIPSINKPLPYYSKNVGKNNYNYNYNKKAINDDINKYKEKVNNYKYQNNNNNSIDFSSGSSYVKSQKSRNPKKDNKKQKSSRLLNKKENNLKSTAVDSKNTKSIQKISSDNNFSELWKINENISSNEEYSKSTNIKKDNYHIKNKNNDNNIKNKNNNNNNNHSNTIAESNSSNHYLNSFFEIEKTVYNNNNSHTNKNISKNSVNNTNIDSYNNNITKTNSFIKKKNNNKIMNCKMNNVNNNNNNNGSSNKKVKIINELPQKTPSPIFPIKKEKKSNENLNINIKRRKNNKSLTRTDKFSNISNKINRPLTYKNLFHIKNENAKRKSKDIMNLKQFTFSRKLNEFSMKNKNNNKINLENGNQNQKDMFEFTTPNLENYNNDNYLNESNSSIYLQKFTNNINFKNTSYEDILQKKDSFFDVQFNEEINQENKNKKIIQKYKFDCTNDFDKELKEDEEETEYKENKDENKPFAWIKKLKEISKIERDKKEINKRKKTLQTSTTRSQTQRRITDREKEINTINEEDKLYMLNLRNSSSTGKLKPYTFIAKDELFYKFFKKKHK